MHLISRSPKHPNSLFLPQVVHLLFFILTLLLSGASVCQWTIGAEGEKIMDKKSTYAGIEEMGLHILECNRPMGE